jgi:hypothetical protein
LWLTRHDTHTNRIKTDYVNAEDKAKEMEQKLEDALKEKYTHDTHERRPQRLRRLGGTADVA